MSGSTVPRPTALFCHPSGPRKSTSFRAPRFTVSTSVAVDWISFHARAEIGARWRWRSSSGQGPIADLLRRRFEVARRRHGLTPRPAPLATDRFTLPPRAGDQGRLF